MGAVRGIAVDGLESGATKAELDQTQVDCDVFWFSRVETGKHPEAGGERREARGERRDRTGNGTVNCGSSIRESGGTKSYA
jgi:hypothetical protein